jgi:phospholipid-translocating ATPase
VQTTLETLRHAGIKIWMLTGDKIETATCIAVSSKLVARNQFIFQLVTNDIGELDSKLEELARRPGDSAVVIDGSTLQLALDHREQSVWPMWLTHAVPCKHHHQLQ